MRALILALASLVSCSAFADFDWSNVPLDRLPKATVIQITKDIEFLPSQCTAELGTWGQLLAGSQQYRGIQCTISLSDCGDSGFILRQPLEMTEVAVKLEERYNYYYKYELKAVSNKTAFLGVTCLPVESKDGVEYFSYRDGRSSVADLVSLISQFGEVTLPPPREQRPE